MHGKNLIKVLGLSALAIVAVTALSAATAQANWVLKRNGSSVKTLQLEASLLEKELLLPNLGLTIRCTGGAATVAILNETTALSGSIHATFTGCTVLVFPNCQVSSLEQAHGTILVSGSGSIGHFGGRALLLPESTSFSEIEVLGVLCPVDELHAVLNGALRFLILESESELTTHLAHLDDHGLFFGEEEAFIDGPSGADTALSHVTHTGGGTWSIKLINLFP